MKIIHYFPLFLAVLFCVPRSNSQIENRKKLAVAFNASIAIDQDAAKESILKQLPELKELFHTYDIAVEYAYAFTEKDILRMQKEAMRVSNNQGSIDNLRNVFHFTFQDITDSILVQIPDNIKRIPGVRYCEKVNTSPIPPPYDIPPTTPNYESQQTYLNSNPGVDMRHAWQKGINGSGIHIRNVEYGFNKDHEEFNDNPSVFIQPGLTVHANITPDYSEHGTATFGVLYADKGEYGVSGMVHGAEEVILFPEYTEEYYYNRSQAVSRAINNSQEGDVLIYEMQTGGYATNEDDPSYVPAEYDYQIWDLTKAATDMGITVVAAAGNGAQDLDAPEYNDYMARGNSGAIIVGAGAANTSHNRLYFSTFGSRVNLQGWGENVLSTGYGDFIAIGDDFNQYYTHFSGTSSATPIVAACVVAVQSYYYSETGTYLSNEEIINLLQTTGIPQGGGGNIGPLPNLKNALESLATTLSNPSLALKSNINVYPNPFEHTVYLAGSLNEQTSIKVLNTLGEEVFSAFDLESNSLDLSSLKSGVYFLEITSNNHRQVCKIIKQ